MCKEKYCSSCKKIKKADQFNVNNHAKDGRYYLCKICLSEKLKDSRKERNESYKKYYHDNLEKQRKYHREYMRNWRLKNKENESNITSNI